MKDQNALSLMTVFSGAKARRQGVFSLAGCSWETIFYAQKMNLTRYAVTLCRSGERSKSWAYSFWSENAFASLMVSISNPAESTCKAHNKKKNRSSKKTKNVTLSSWKNSFLIRFLTLKGFQSLINTRKKHQFPLAVQSVFRKCHFI